MTVKITQEPHQSWLDKMVGHWTYKEATSLIYQVLNIKYNKLKKKNKKKSHANAMLVKLVGNPKPIYFLAS